MLTYATLCMVYIPHCLVGCAVSCERIVWNFRQIQSVFLKKKWYRQTNKEKYNRNNSYVSIMHVNDVITSVCLKKCDCLLVLGSLWQNDIKKSSLLKICTTTAHTPYTINIQYTFANSQKKYIKFAVLTFDGALHGVYNLKQITFK